VLFLYCAAAFFYFTMILSLMAGVQEVMPCSLICTCTITNRPQRTYLCLLLFDLSFVHA